MSEERSLTGTLFRATDSEGRLYLTDSREHLPADAIDIQEVPVEPHTVERAILKVEVEELRLTPVTIHIGGYTYATPSASDLPQWLAERRREAA